MTALAAKPTTITKLARAAEAITPHGKQNTKSKKPNAREMTYALARLQKQSAGKNLNTLGRNT